MKRALAAAGFALFALAGCGEDSPSDTDTEKMKIAQICPAPGERTQEHEYRDRAEEALVGKPFEAAQEVAEASGCHVAAISIDGEAQVLTREYDPTRIQVDVRDGNVQRVVGFG